MTTPGDPSAMLVVIDSFGKIYDGELYTAVRGVYPPGAELPPQPPGADRAIFRRVVGQTSGIPDDVLAEGLAE